MYLIDVDIITYYRMRFDCASSKLSSQWQHSLYMKAILPMATSFATASGNPLNKKMSSYQYMDSHDKDKPVVRSFDRYNGDSNQRKDRFYIETGPWSL